MMYRGHNLQRQHVEYRRPVVCALTMRIWLLAACSPARTPSPNRLRFLRRPLSCLVAPLSKALALGTWTLKRLVDLSLEVSRHASCLVDVSYTSQRSALSLPPGSAILVRIEMLVPLIHRCPQMRSSD